MFTDKYEANARLLKVLSDAGRLKIIEILSCGERCACDLKAYFPFSQPTLSHHMRLLVESGLVLCRKEGHWIFYSLNPERIREVAAFVGQLSEGTEDCLCHGVPRQKGINETDNERLRCLEKCDRSTDHEK